MKAIYPEPLVLRPGPAAAMIGVGRTKLYELMDSGQLRWRTDGCRRLVCVESLKAYNERQFKLEGGKPAHQSNAATARATLATNRLAARARAEV